MARVSILALVPGLVMLAGCGASEPVTVAPRVLRFGTGTPGGGFRPLGAALARAFADAKSNIQLQAQESAGSVSNVLALQEGHSDVALAVADVAYMAVASRLPDVPVRLDRLRGVAVMQLTPLHLVAGPRSSVTRIEDLSGRRVALGPQGGGTALSASLVMTALGVNVSLVHTEQMLFNDAAARVLDGRLDAMFVNGSYPAESVRLALAGGARLLPISTEQAQHIRQSHPFFRPTMVPGGTYPGHPDPVYTIGIDTLLLCRSDLDPDAVYELTRTLFRILPSLVGDHPALRSIDLEQVAATPIPLHAGAARYYREREIGR